MKGKITYRQIVYLTLTKDEVKILMTASRHHYDGECKRLSKDGGILDQYYHCMRTGRALCATAILTFREIDLLRKCAEMLDHPEANKLFDKLGHVLREMNSIAPTVSMVEFDFEENNDETTE